MASTNKTTNYELSQYVGSDKPTYLGDYNSDMLKIDTAMKNNADNIASASSLATTASQNASTALTNASTAQNTAESAQQTATTANQTGTSALNKANQNETDILGLESDVDKLKPVILYDNDTGSKQNISLSDSSANYDYMEIYAITPVGMLCEKVYNPNDKAVVFSSMNYSNGFMYFYVKRVKVEANAINVRFVKTYQFADSSSWSPYGSNDDNFAICRVVGYKQQTNS